MSFPVPNSSVSFYSLLTKDNITRPEPSAQDIYTNKMKDTLPTIDYDALFEVHANITSYHTIIVLLSDMIPLTVCNGCNQPLLYKISILLNNIILERGRKVLTASWREFSTKPRQSVRK